MTAAAAVVLDDQIHLLDSFGPDDGAVLPKLGHRHVSLIHPLFAVNARSGTAVPITLAFIGDVAERPGGRRATRRFLEDLGADVDSPVAIIYRTRLVTRPIGIEHRTLDVIVRLARRRCVRC